jgi:hypothetical protein
MDSSQVIALIAGASVQGVPLIFVVLGLVQYAKKVGIKGNALLYVSMIVGVALGIAYQGYVLASAAGPGPATAGAWYAAVFAMVIYGLLLGIVASGVYDVADGIVTTAVARLSGQRPPGWTGAAATPPSAPPSTRR